MTWRNRYSQHEYPEKVTLNIFYRKYTMEFMLSDIMGSFEDDSTGGPIQKWNDFTDGLQKLTLTYSNTTTGKTHSQLMQLLIDHKRNVGNTNYGIFVPLITGAQNGDYSKLEEIEYAYLYYFLTDESILVWSAFGGTGLSKLDAIGKLTGLILETEEITQYAQIEQILGQFCSAPYLKENYKPLPPNG